MRSYQSDVQPAWLTFAVVYLWMTGSEKKEELEIEKSIGKSIAVFSEYLPE